ncbi:ribonuclease Z [Myroides sp. LJL119]
MRIKEKGHSVILTDSQSDVATLVEKIKQQYNNGLSNKNIIVDLTVIAKPIAQEDLYLFEPLALNHLEKANKSFVIVIADVDFNDFDKELVVVPTVLEAGDIIDMDEIQRDLGF